MAQSYPLRRRSSDPILHRNFSETNNNSYSAPSTSRVNMRLPSGLNLPLNNMALPIYTAPSREDVEIRGRVLLQHFIQEELLNQGISEQMLEIHNPPSDVFDEVNPGVMQGDGDVAAQAISPAFNLPEGYKSAMSTAIGAEIRNIADKFAQSQQRKDIQDLASGVKLKHIDYSSFLDILRVLFKDGIDKYKIVSLFYFCSDVVIRCVQAELHQLASKLFFWVLEFLLKNICKWVQDHGGWERVFSNIFTVVYNVSKIAALGVVIGCGIVWIRNNK